MARVFNRSANSIAHGTLAGAIVLVVALSLIGAALYRSPMVSGQNIYLDQPIPFSHQRHVGGNDIDCRYCHTSVENSNFAGIPATETCMTCHSQVLADADLLQPVHESWKNDEPIAWNRVYDMPDFVYFDHSIHVAQGIGCTTCHGPIDEMELTYQFPTLHMAWCLECHRAPEDFIRPKDQVFNVDWEPGKGNDFVQEVDGPRLVEEYGINKSQLTNCWICHR